MKFTMWVHTTSTTFLPQAKWESRNGKETPEEDGTKYWQNGIKVHVLSVAGELERSTNPAVFCFVLGGELSLL